MRKFIWLFVSLGIATAFLFVVDHFDRHGPINEATKTCLVTGVSSGIGRELAVEMVRRGWAVIGVARRAERLAVLQQELGATSFIPFVCDVSKPEFVRQASDLMKERGLRPTLFFLNAGIGNSAKKWDFSVNLHEQTFATNYFGALSWIEAWLSTTRELGGGTFVAISSVLALFALPGSDAYAASKVALKHCFESLRRQYIRENIQFSVVLPGPVDTEMLKGDGVRSLPFIHEAHDEARYIVDQVFAGRKEIEPAWFYAVLLKFAHYLPDFFVAKIL